jgi:hypothetical protein
MIPSPQLLQDMLKGIWSLPNSSTI